MNSDDELAGLVGLGDRLYTFFIWRNKEECTAKECRKVFIWRAAI